MYQPPGIFKRFKTWARNLLGRKISAPIEQAQAALPICLNRLRRRAANIFNNLPVQPRLKRFQVPGRQTWFGYYDHTPFDMNGSRVLVMVGERWGRTPQPGDEVQLGYFEISQPNNFHLLGSTTTWCWQQGCRLRWWSRGDGEPELIFCNRLIEGEYGSVLLDPATGSIVETFNSSIYDLDPWGERSLTLNFSRLQRLRPGYGYVDLPDATADEPCPENDGVWDFDHATGECRLLVSLRTLVGIKPQPSMQGGEHYINHLSYSPGGERILFFHLWVCGGRRHCRMLVGDRNGQNLKVIQDEGMASHYAWRDDNTILATVHQEGKCAYCLFDLLAGTRLVFGEGQLVKDGHPSYGVDGITILTDTYRDSCGEQHLMLYGPECGIRDLGRYFSPSRFTGEWRCDLHPRWDHSGCRIAFDSTHDDWRALYVLDMDDLTQPG